MPPKLRRKKPPKILMPMAADPLQIAANYRKDAAKDLRSNLQDPNVVETLKLVILKNIVDTLAEESVAAREAGVPVPLFEAWKRDDEVFGAALAEAFRQATDRLATIGMRRASVKSDRLMEFFLAQRDEARFGRDGKPGAGGGTISMTLQQLDDFLQRKRNEELLLLKTIDGQAVDVTPESES